MTLEEVKKYLEAQQETADVEIRDIVNEQLDMMEQELEDAAQELDNVQEQLWRILDDIEDFVTNLFDIARDNDIEDQLPDTYNDIIRLIEKAQGLVD